MIHVKGGIGQIKNQIHKDDIAKNNNPASYRYSCTGRAAHLKVLQRYEKQ